MRIRVLILAVTVALAGGRGADLFRNEKVVVSERLLEPGATDEGTLPAITVFFDGGSLEVARPGGKPATQAVRRGEASRWPAGPLRRRNAGSTALHYARIEFRGPGSDERWGRTGLPPNYTLLADYRYARVYDIRIPAHSREEQHTHRDRVVVCLSGATLRHRYPDGREEPSTLKTGEVAWRCGGTHIGENLGETDLWVIAVEPK